MIKHFFLCGTVGWCLEIIFTSLNSLRHHDTCLTAKTSLWMFPIYGCAAFLKPVSLLIRKRSLLFRGLTYMGLIFSTEFITGTLLCRFHSCPWDYSHSKWNIRKVIRLDYAPYWFGAGLLFERILK